MHPSKTLSFIPTVALVGNPNVGKSTLFNALTGLKQHTGNWPGKTVGYAEGYYTYAGETYRMIDLPGIYSLATHSKEEEVTRDAICCAPPDVIVVVCDATCLERNLILVLQTLELNKHVILCINLLDEAKKKNISIDLKQLSDALKLPVIGTCAQTQMGLKALEQSISQAVHTPSSQAFEPPYPAPIEEAIATLTPYVNPISCKLKLTCRFLCLKLLEDETAYDVWIKPHLSASSPTSSEDSGFIRQIAQSRNRLLTYYGSLKHFQDTLVTSTIQESEQLAQSVTTFTDPSAQDRDLRIDRILIGRYTALPIMLLLLALILWLTIMGANYPSQALFTLFALLEKGLSECLYALGITGALYDLFINGVYRVLSWVIAVMLPPMAIFFPLFTLLEDLGYLPRIAFNLDYPFKKCCACGKQALTMCMGLGCNAVGVEGCRIIDSPRERLIALLTNSLVPCNGRFPTLILLISLFFMPTHLSLLSTLLSAAYLIGAFLLSLSLTFLTSYLLSKTLLKGLPSSFTLELPPYRRPQLGQILIRSLLDRTLYVLRRAALVAAPAGLVIWLLAHCPFGDSTLLAAITHVLDPFAKCFGLDGVILTAFVLGFPANEIILPIMIMIYLSSGALAPLSQPAEIHQLLLAHGWQPITALCTFVFLLIHWPCSTTLWTIYKETQSFKWTLWAFLIPTCWGLFLCFLLSHLAMLF